MCVCVSIISSARKIGVFFSSYNLSIGIHQRVEMIILIFFNNYNKEYDIK